MQRATRVDVFALMNMFHTGRRGLHPEKWFHWTCTNCGHGFEFSIDTGDVKPATLDGETWINNVRAERSKLHYRGCKM